MNWNVTRRLSFVLNVCYVTQNSRLLHFQCYSYHRPPIDTMLNHPPPQITSLIALLIFFLALHCFTANHNSSDFPTKILFRFFILPFLSTCWNCWVKMLRNAVLPNVSTRSFSKQTTPSLFSLLSTITSLNTATYFPHSLCCHIRGLEL